MLPTVLEKLLSTLLSYFNRLHLFSFILLCSLFTFLLYFPDFHIFKNTGKDAYSVFDKQIERPLDNNSYSDNDYTAFNSHVEKTKFRLSVPLIARVLHVRAYHMILLQFFLLPLFYFVFFTCIVKITHDKNTAYLLSFAGIFYFVFESFDYMMPFYDPYAFLFLAAAFATNRAPFKFILLLLACFTDERAILGTGVLLLTEYVMLYKSLSLKKLLYPTKILLPYLLSWLLYFGFRFYMIIARDYNIPLDKSHGGGLADLSENFTAMCLGVLTALEGYWIICLIGAALLIYQKRYFELMIVTVLSGIFILSSLLAYDITRTFVYMFPLIFMLLAYIRQTESDQTLQKIGLSVVFANILIPTYLIWGGTSTMIFWTSPIIPKIYYLLH